jgi:hypothetical protein
MLTADAFARGEKNAVIAKRLRVSVRHRIAQQPRLPQSRRLRDRTRDLTATPMVSVKAEQAQVTIAIRSSSRPVQHPRGTLPDMAWAQRHPSHSPQRASQFRCHPIVHQTHAAAVAGELQPAIVTADEKVKHALRHADGKWTPPPEQVGNIPGIPATGSTD